MECQRRYNHYIYLITAICGFLLIARTIVGGTVRSEKRRKLQNAASSTTSPELGETVIRPVSTGSAILLKIPDSSVLDDFSFNSPANHNQWHVKIREGESSKMKQPVLSDEPSKGRSFRSQHQKDVNEFHNHYDDKSSDDLFDEFHEWTLHHRRDYRNDLEEKERRFDIWKENHFRTMKKNNQHGPCKMTNQAVFGSNHFKDLSPEEFRSMYLPGYKHPETSKVRHRRTLGADQDITSSIFEKPKQILYHNSKVSNAVNTPQKNVKRHEDVQERYLKHTKDTPPLEMMIEERWFGSSTNKNNYKETRGTTQTSNNYNASYSCRWYDVSCWLRKIFGPFFSYSGGTREPVYDESSYPSAIDWRELGAVTEVHSQGNCGACWAITAVETIESANYIETGILYDLAETEIIACEDSCEMCNGGWPQNAYDYVAERKGLPLEETLYYDGDFLLTLTYVNAGESDELSQDEVEQYLGSVCPYNEGNSNSGSGDNYYDSGSSPRYAAVKGYAYATDQCVCYSDGSGCDCDSQNEALAVRNVASYGPATICLDAAVWQDYAGGIITSDSGCSSSFTDMNHCVQAVGYAFTDVSDNDNDNSGSESNSNSGSNDNAQREGYWIVRNQWGEYWGMNGYIYVAMGDNTCGILNDMTQVFIDD